MLIYVRWSYYSGIYTDLQYAIYFLYDIIGAIVVLISMRHRDTTVFNVPSNYIIIMDLYHRAKISIFTWKENSIYSHE